MLDLVLAVAHHLLIFGLFGILAAELIAVRRDMDQAAIRRVAMTDLWSGLLAGLILIVGFSRAIFAAKGWAYYADNIFFWAKIGAFTLIALLSSRPTVAFIRWRKATGMPNDAEVAAVRRFLWIEAVLFAFLLAFAAAMARGYGEL